MEEERKGKIEGFGLLRPFSNGRGSLGVKVNGRWQSLIDNFKKLESTKSDVPLGSLVEFRLKTNAKGYEDIEEGTFKVVSLNKFTGSQKSDNQELNILIECLHTATKLSTMNDSLDDIMNKTTDIFILFSNLKKKLLEVK
jgi:hypothetical protein